MALTLTFRAGTLSFLRATRQLGAGWTWLAVKGGRIIVANTTNAESPLVHGGSPILGCDIWEHSYYLSYRNRRQDYLKAFLDHLVDWDYVGELFDDAMKQAR